MGKITKKINKNQEKAQTKKSKKAIWVVALILVIVAIIIAIVAAQALSKTENQEETAQTQKSVIKINENAFAMKMDDIYMNYTKYTGKEISYEGFIFLQGGYTVVARLYNCCGTDSYPIGLEIEYDGEIPAANSWVKVEGTIATRTDEDTGEEYPYIQATSLEVQEKRGNDTVYQ